MRQAFRRGFERVRLLKGKKGSEPARILMDSLRFAGRRLVRRTTGKARAIKTILVDFDSTLARQEVLTKILGEEQYRAIVKAVSEGKISKNEGWYRLVTEGPLRHRFSRGDFKRFVHESVMQEIRTGLVKTLKRIKDAQRNNVRIVLVTANFASIANEINRELSERYGFSFDGIVASQERFDSRGRFVGLNRLIAGKNGKYQGTAVQTKLTAVKQEFRRNNWTFDPKHCIQITDSYGDVELARQMRTILIKGTYATPTALQQVGQNFRMADWVLTEDENLGRKIRLLLEKPELVARVPDRRIDQWKKK